MSKGPRPDVSALLRALREKADQIETGAHLRATPLVQVISDRVASLPGLEPVRPEVDPILERLQQAAERIEPGVRFYDVGTVQHIGDGVATLSGLPNATTDELVNFSTGVQGLILSLYPARLDVVMLGSDAGIQGGDLVTATGQRARLPVGHRMLGRVINPIGEPLDQRGPIETAEQRYLEHEAPDVIERTPVNQPLHTGVKIVDALLPIGRGQRELILGDRQTGKTTLAVDAIMNQRDQDVACVYVAIGQKKSTTLAVIETLRAHGALDHTTVFVSSPDDPPALRYLAPFAGCAMAEFLMAEGRDALIVYDDLSKHADAYRELSLLLRRPPGREAYPGDIFFIHARLLERACKRHDNYGGGSITALPIVETQRGNLSTYIPTNLISICDGQIVFDSDLFNRGLRPAVDIGLSVSRVGGEAQTDAMRKVSGELKLELAQYEEVAHFARFGTQVDQATRQQIQRGERLRAALKQPAHRTLPLAHQVVLLLAATEGFLDALQVDQVPNFEQRLLSHMEQTHLELVQQINRAQELDSETRAALRQAIAEYQTEWLGGRER